MRTLTLLLLLLFSSEVVAQTVKVEAKTALVGIKNPTLVGGVVVVEDISSMTTTPAAYVTIDTTAENVIVEASDLQRNRIEVITIDKTNYLIPAKGKIWVDVLCIDFSKNIFIKETKIVELSPAPEPDPKPDPDVPTPNPDVDTDVFDNIGQRVAAVTKRLPNNLQIRTIYKTASDKLKSDPSVTINDSATYIAGELLKINGYTEQYKEFIKLVNDDIAKRWPMSRGVMADYWLAVSKGFK
jgi:hypothetical protein